MSGVRALVELKRFSWFLVWSGLLGFGLEFWMGLVALVVFNGLAVGEMDFRLRETN